MHKHLLDLQELSLELSSHVETLDRATDALSATKAYRVDDISNESSSAFMRAIGLESGTNVKRDELLALMEKIYRDATANTYRKVRQFDGSLSAMLHHLKGQVEFYSPRVQLDKPVRYVPDSYSRQTLTVKNTPTNDLSFMIEAKRFLQLFGTLAVELSPQVMKTTQVSDATPDPGYGLEIIKRVHSQEAILNNTTIRYHNYTYKPWRWQVVTERPTRPTKEVSFWISSTYYTDLYSLLQAYVSVFEEGLHKGVGFKDLKGSDPATYAVTMKLYIPLFMILARITHVITEMMDVARLAEGEAS